MSCNDQVHPERSLRFSLSFLECCPAFGGLDLERPSDVAKLADPELCLSRLSGQLLILDEFQRLPEFIPVLPSLFIED